MRAAHEKALRSRSAFRLSVDHSRPCFLEGDFAEDAAVLTYQYTDTGERVTVPNTWRNQPAERRANQVRGKIQAAEQRARVLTQSPPIGLEHEAIDFVVARHHANAERYKEMLDEILSEPSVLQQDPLADRALCEA